MLTQNSQEQSALMSGQSQGWSSSGGRGRVGAGMVETIDRDVDAAEDDNGWEGKPLIQAPMLGPKKGPS